MPRKDELQLDISKEERLKIVRLALSGRHSKTALAAQYGFSRMTLHKWIKAHNQQQVDKARGASEKSASGTETLESLRLRLQEIEAELTRTQKLLAQMLVKHGL